MDKILYPRLFAESVLAYEIVPTQLVTLVALVIPWLEAVAGLCLILGLVTRAAACIIGVLSLSFAGAVTWATISGMEISCGCFSFGADTVGWVHVAFDIVLAISAFAIARSGPGALALDSRILTDL